MDGVLVDFKSAYPKLKNHERAKYNPTDKPDRDAAYDEVPTIFSRMNPVDGALEAFDLLSQFYDTYILSTAPWDNPSAWSDKLDWVKTNLGRSAYKRLILSHNKHLNYGDYLIDDRDKNGADRFRGELIRFGSARFPDWTSVVEYLR